MKEARWTNSIARWPPFRPFLWASIAVFVAAAFAASLFAPITWREYFAYLLRSMGWPLVSALATAAVVVVILLFAASHRRASGIAAASMFVSVVLHMMLVSVFGLVAIRNKATSYVVTRKAPEISFSLPALVESLVSQKLRSEYFDTSMPDKREFEAARKPRDERQERRLDAPKPATLRKETPEPSPEKMEAEQASRPKQRLEEALAKPQERLPDVTKPDVTQPRQVKTAREKIEPARQPVKELQVDRLQAAGPRLPAETRTTPLEVGLKDPGRELSRQNPEIASARPPSQRVTEEMAGASIADKTDNLRLQAERAAPGANMPKPEARQPRPAESFELAHDAAGTPDAPSLQMPQGKLAAAPVRPAGSSLAGPGPAPLENMPAVKDAAAGSVATAPSLSQPLHMIARAAAVSRQGDSQPEPARVVAPRNDLRADRVVVTVADIQAASAEPGAPLRRSIADGTETSHMSLADKTSFRGASAAAPGVSDDVGNRYAGVRNEAAGGEIVAGPAPAAVSTGAETASAGQGAASAQAAMTALRVDKAATGSGKPDAAGNVAMAPANMSVRVGRRDGSLVDSSEVAAGAPRAASAAGGVEDGYSMSAARDAASRSGPVSLGISARQIAGRGEPSRRDPDGPSGPSPQSSVNVAKAGGAAFRDDADAGLEVEFDPTSMSAPPRRAPAKIEVAVAGRGDNARIGVPADIAAGEGAGRDTRVLISAELSAVPQFVPEKAIYKLRTPERRKEFIRELGGSEKTEAAVELALAWLAKAQSDDGRWDVDNFKTLAKCGGPGDQSDEDVALTGLCLLSYLGAGYTHVKGEYRETVRNALNWLVLGQKEDGDLQRNGRMYGQAIATIALSECYSMTGDERLREPVERAVAFILKAQNPHAGWRYFPRTDNDTSVTGWQVLAIRSAMIAGIEIPSEHFNWVEEWLDQVRRGEKGGLYTYMRGHGATPTMTAEGWFCQLLMRKQARTRGLEETIPYLMANLPAWTPDRSGSINLYYWYYATLALHMSGATEFVRWNEALTEALLKGQSRKGEAAGSWDPECVLGERGGRVYTTAISALCLEVYYRYLPFYKQ